MSRPSGRASSSIIDSVMAQMAGLDRRVVISGKISDQLGVDHVQASLPSVHLRWGLQQMRTRGWRNDDWGHLLNPDETVGDGPICLLESVQAPMDAPDTLNMETPEQYYLRLAIVKLGWEPPVYLSTWNDEQETFETVETLMNTAITWAEVDEAAGLRPWEELSNLELRELYGITEEALRAAKDAEREAAKG